MTVKINKTATNFVLLQWLVADRKALCATRGLFGRTGQTLSDSPPMKAAHVR